MESKIKIALGLVVLAACCAFIETFFVVRIFFPYESLFECVFVAFIILVIYASAAMSASFVLNTNYGWSERWIFMFIWILYFFILTITLSFHHH
jgi:hypothetical protein